MLPPPDTLICADNISFSRGGVNILNHVSVTVNRHDFITIIGPNGAGKSTLLKCLAGLTNPNSGTVNRIKPLKIGYVPQRLMVDRAMPITTRHFITLHKRATADDIERTTMETGIQHILNQPLQSLSSGELQRALMTRALLNTPDLLILDEPAQNLDVAGQLAFYKLLEKIYHDWHIAILMVSHDLHLVMSCTRRVLCLYHHVCCSGEPQTITQDPEFVSLFGADMAHMMAVYHHTHNHRHDNHPST
ncbi:ATP-binding cassette domain-containing protein [Candidatus Persebacteraceae bacterium Df01]|jgi:zinc transport system ATP-binding protein|uniref:ATP-binding cassette domain-containing protein n=1 Tax=Candidatus Doriopsillibacter californiensis TaxID=2970740 RepID=A0ABT7QNB3_9GAMM|nr:ATP-binding cassette domain-containing protein [Candidatus Persebacteraceae bacterium Df01]